MHTLRITIMFQKSIWQKSSPTQTLFFSTLHIQTGSPLTGLRNCVWKVKLLCNSCLLKCPGQFSYLFPSLLSCIAILKKTNKLELKPHVHFLLKVNTYIVIWCCGKKEGMSEYHRYHKKAKAVVHYCTKPYQWRGPWTTSKLENPSTTCTP